MKVDRLNYYPTILSITNSTINKKDAEKLNGLNITDVLTGESNQVTDAKGKPRENLFWHFPHNSDNSMQSALRDGDFKLYKNHLDGSYELYRLYVGEKRNDFEEKFNLAEQTQYRVTLRNLSQKLEVQLTANDAQYPHYNGKYKGDLPGLKQVPIITSNHFYKHNRIGTIKLETDKTPIRQAYALGEVVARKLSIDDKPGKMMTTYEKLPATISKNGLTVSANIPKQYKKYLMVIVDHNNFIVTSDTYSIEKVD